MIRPSLRRPGAALAVAAVTATGLAALPAAPAAAAAVAPLHPAAASGAAWAAGQVEDGVVVGDYGPDLGLSIDAALALDSVGRQRPTVDRIADQVAAGLTGYISGEAFGDAGSTYAGATAKAAVLATTVGRDPRRFGGLDLVQRLESVVADAGPAAGRIADVSAYGDYANTLGQSYAVTALTAGGSSEAAAATEFLLDQQCAAGFFRLQLPAAAAADHACDADPDAAPDTDATALAVIALDDVAGAEGAVDRAVDWLVAHQRPDGGFGGGVATEGPNTNSTGLAGWALGTAGSTEAAARAAAWVAHLQVGEQRPCSTGPLGAETGAVAYDAAALAAARDAGITAAVRDQWRRATFQGLPALRWLPGTTAALRLRAPSGYQRAGRTARLRVTGLAATETGCLAGPGTALTVAGGGARAVRLPAGTGTRTYTVTGQDGRTARARVKVLGAKALPVRVRARVARGGVQVATVRGLAARERVTVRLRGSKIAAGRANARGRYTARFRVTAAPGRARVVVTGQFADRRRATTFRVVR